jgi:preprotein translocase subunit SecG
VELTDYLNIGEILISIALIAIILLQVKGEGVGGLQSGSFVRTRRGLEKTLFQLTIVLVVLFLVVSAVSVQQGVPLGD